MLDKLGFLFSKKILILLSGLIFTGVAFASSGTDALFQNSNIISPQVKIPDVEKIEAQTTPPGTTQTQIRASTTNSPVPTPKPTSTPTPKPSSTILPKSVTFSGQATITGLRRDTRETKDDEEDTEESDDSSQSAINAAFQKAREED